MINRALLVLVSILTFAYGEAQKPTVAVIDFDSKHSEHAIILADQIRTHLSMSPLITVLTRDAIAKIMIEQEFQVSGLVNEESQAEFGQLLGAQYLVTGKVTKSGINYFLTAQVVDVTTGKVISSGSAYAMSIQLLCTNGCEKIAKTLLNGLVKDFVQQ